MEELLDSECSEILDFIEVDGAYETLMEIFANMPSDSGVECDAECLIEMMDEFKAKV